MASERTLLQQIAKLRLEEAKLLAKKKQFPARITLQDMQSSVH
jgi:hypothetical protein